MGKLYISNNIGAWRLNGVFARPSRKTRLRLKTALDRRVRLCNDPPWSNPHSYL